MLASLPIELANGSGRKSLKDYRRFSRVVIAAGSQSYIDQLCRSLVADQLADTNILSEKLEETDILVVPVLLKDIQTVGNTKEAWLNVQPQESDRNFDRERANEIVAYPLNEMVWMEYLKSEIDTAVGQGFDVLEKGINIIVKKNGRILRRATGLPPFGDLVATMEVADGSKFGMPGDSEKYGGR